MSCVWAYLVPRTTAEVALFPPGSRGPAHLPFPAGGGSDAIGRVGASTVGFRTQWSPAGTGHQHARANDPLLFAACERALAEAPREHRGGQTRGDDGPRLAPSHEATAAGRERRVPKCHIAPSPANR